MARLTVKAWAVLFMNNMIEETTVNSAGDSFALFRSRKDARAYSSGDRRHTIRPATITLKLAPKRKANKGAAR